MSAHAKLNLYLHTESFVLNQQTPEDPRLTSSADALAEHDDPAVHLVHLKRERRATAPAGKPRRLSKLDEAIKRADASFVRLSVTDLVSSPYSAPFTLGDDRETHEARRHAGPRASFSSTLSGERRGEGEQTATSPCTPRTPLTGTKTPPNKFVHAAPYLHDDPAGVSKVSPHFADAELVRHRELRARPTLAAWTRSAHQKHQPKLVAAEPPRGTARHVGKASARATTEQLADLKLRDQCLAMRNRAEAGRPVSKKPSRIASLLEAVKKKTKSRILIFKRALHARA